MGVSIWEGGKAERAAAALEAIAETFDVIDDTSGAGDTDATWSADKITTELAGKASLDSGGKVPSSQLPSYVDDVLEYASTSAFPQTGESGKIYVALDTGKTYRWTGSTYAEISQGAVTDIQVNGTSVLSSGIANIPVASANNLGVVKVDQAYGITRSNTSDKLVIFTAGPSEVKNGIETYRPIVPVHQHESAFYGLAKAAGDSTQASSNNAVGTYTDGAKSAIRSMIGAENGDDIVKVQDVQPTTPATKIWFPVTAPASVQVPTVEEMNAAIPDIQINGTSIVNNGVANIPKASADTFGAVKIGQGLQIYNEKICTNPASQLVVKVGNDGFTTISPQTQHVSAFYGLAKAAGDSTQSASNNSVGTYTEDAKIKIQKMLGIYQAPWELLRDDTVTHSTSELYDITTDSNGNAFELTDFRLLIQVPPQESTFTITSYATIMAMNGTTTKTSFVGYGSETYTISPGDNKYTMNFEVVRENGMAKMSGMMLQKETGRTNLQTALYYNPSSSSKIYIYNDNDPFTKIRIPAFSGTINFRLYGKRKWTL